MIELGRLEARDVEERRGNGDSKQVSTCDEYLFLTPNDICRLVKDAGQVVGLDLGTEASDDPVAKPSVDKRAPTHILIRHPIS